MREGNGGGRAEIQRRSRRRESFVNLSYPGATELATKLTKFMLKKEH